MSDVMPIVASAPGKVILSGEYAVLDGAPAVCVAIDRRARVTVEYNDEDHHVVAAPGHAESTARFRVADGVVEWLAGGEDLKLVEDLCEPQTSKQAGTFQFAWTQANSSTRQVAPKSVSAPVPH